MRGDENACWSCGKHIVITTAAENQSYIAEGDIVVVYSDKQPSSCWKLGRIDYGHGLPQQTIVKVTSPYLLLNNCMEIEVKRAQLQWTEGCL